MRQGRGQRHVPWTTPAGSTVRAAPPAPPAAGPQALVEREAQGAGQRGCGPPARRSSGAPGPMLVSPSSNT